MKQCGLLFCYTVIIFLGCIGSLNCAVLNNEIQVSEWGRAVAVDNEGNIYTFGEFSGPIDIDPGPGVYDLVSNGVDDQFLSKLDPDGNLIWVLHWEEPWIYPGETSVDNSGYVYIAGSFVGEVDFDPGQGSEVHYSVGQRSQYLCKFDASGNLVWAKTWGNRSGFTGLNIDFDDIGVVYLIGQYFERTDFDPGPGVEEHTPNRVDEMFISSFDIDGNFLGVQVNGVGYDAVVSFDGDGNIFTTGKFDDYIHTIDLDPGPGLVKPESNGEYDVYLAKYGPERNLIWAKTWGGASFDYSGDCEVDNSGNIYVCGLFKETVDFDPDQDIQMSSSNGNYDIFMSKFNPDGELVWVRTWGGADADKASGITVSNNGDIFITGNFSGRVDFDPGPGEDEHRATGYNDIFISKFDSDGNFIWALTWGGENMSEPF